MPSLLLACTLSLSCQSIYCGRFLFPSFEKENAVRTHVPLHFFPFEFLNLKFSLRARSPAIAEHQAAVPLPSPTNHSTAAATPVLARFSLRARCCSVVRSAVPGVADAARVGEAGLFELPSTSASVARRARPPRTGRLGGEVAGKAGAVRETRRRRPSTSAGCLHRRRSPSPPTPTPTPLRLPLATSAPLCPSFLCGAPLLANPASNLFPSLRLLRNQLRFDQSAGACSRGLDQLDSCFAGHPLRKKAARD
ncbi:uncharacterized protein LOC120294121 [Eucalyptus grandis]|uniref:uncharacterized protein LOC120294121 n=1 Tax=Eucalyptus grandis TaxID=71139 RepID=UPI00192EDC12|nr:uncharacterized protein LOC120294121 [Eucalyptus grandis]